MKLSQILLLLFVISSCKNVEKKEDLTGVLNETDNVQTEKLNTLELEIYDYNGFEIFLNKKDDKVYVINFWATWCAPCVKELPHFEKLNADFKNKNVEVILVSLDFPHLYEKKLIPFIEEKNLASKVIVLDDVDMNTWIPKVDESWTGSIPATIIYKNDKKQFYERSFNFEELEKEVKHFLN